MTTIPTALLDTATRFPDRPALVGADVLTWAQVYDSALRGARALPVKPRDRVALWGANSTQWVLAELAVLCAGAVAVPINSRYRPEEASEIVTRAGCAVVFADAETEPAARRIGGVTSVLRLDQSWTTLVAATEPAEPAPVSGDDVSHVQFTSGTTGRPKGALLLHRAMVATTRSWTQIVGIEPTDHYPVVAPFSHVAGHKSGILACVVTGAALRPLGAFNADELATLVAAGEASVLQGAPAMYQALMGSIERRQLHPTGVKVAVAGAAIVSPMLVRRLREVLDVGAVLNGYGLSEATGVVAITRRDDPEEIVTTTCGRPVTGVSLRVVDPDGTPLAVGEAGEVEVSGINVMQGYLDDPEATAATIHDGWLRTGDIGTLDGAGNLRIVDRLKDLVVVGGYNVSPAEVERILAEDPMVREVAVVGRADERMGEVPVAFVVPTDDFDAAAVQARAAERLAGFKVPRRYLVIDSLPMTAAGKVDKQVLRARLASGD